MKRISFSTHLILLLCLITIFSSAVSAGQGDRVLFHIKTALSEDDAQICVAYNMIWAALAEGKQVSVLIDASAVNTYKRGWKGKDDLEGYKLPDKPKQELSRQLDVEKTKVPATYGEYLALLHSRGAKFYINGAMLVVSGISREFGDLSRISADFFEPLTLAQMLQLFQTADDIVGY